MSAMLPPLQVQVLTADLSDGSVLRAHLDEVVKYRRALTDAIAGAKRTGKQGIGQANSVEAWEYFNVALGSAEAALALMATGGIR